jgi:hypothetical protein
MARSTTIYTSGVAGSGKTLTRCACFILNEFLPESTGVHYSNFPIGLVPADHPYPPRWPGETFIDRIAEAAEAKYAKNRELEITAASVKKRIHVIPEEVTEAWARGDSGPWEYFAGADLAGCHIAIDECHRFFHPSTSKEYLTELSVFLGQIRHTGCTVEFLSQADEKVAKEIKIEAGLHLECMNYEIERDPFCRIPLADWYELRAAFVGEYRSCFLVTEYGPRSNRKRKVLDKRYYHVDPSFFALYDSHDRPDKNSKAGRRKRMHERLTRWQLVRWFLRSHWFPVCKRAFWPVMIVAAFVIGPARIIGWGLWLGSWAMDIDKIRGGGAVAAKSSPRASTAALEARGLLPAGGDIDPECLALLGGLEAAYTEVVAERDTLQARVVELETVAAQASEMVMLESDSVVLRDGQRYRLGEEIKFGFYGGKSIVRIEKGRRYAELSDGTILRLGGGASGGLSVAGIASSARTAAGI